MAGSNSSIKLQQIVDDAFTLGDVAPALATGGVSDTPALSIANDVMAAIVLGGPQGQPLNWKWNRINVAPFPTISYQQDYLTNTVNLAWIESAWCTNINQTAVIKEKLPLSAHRDLLVTYWQTGYPGKICWMQNDTLQTGVWGLHPFGPTAGKPSGETTAVSGNLTGLQNPGAGVIYTNPVGSSPAGPVNATTGITDPNGNLWVVTQYGTCGNTQPTWPTNPVYPTFNAPTTTATTVTDGTVVWTAVNPKGQGFRLNPIPPQTGVVWLIEPVCQARAVQFTSLSQTLDPIPDDYATYFKQGFFAQCYRRNPDSKVRAKFAEEWRVWLDSLNKAVMSGQREQDDFGFFPSSSIMDSGGFGGWLGPAYPFPPFGA
jgi:hypothetical protein